MSRLTVLAFAMGVTVASAPARADLVEISYYGRVFGTSSIAPVDGLGLFGIAGGFLGNLPFFARVVVDTSKGELISFPDGTQQLHGGSILGLSSPVSATLTINAAS